MLVYPAD